LRSIKDTFDIIVVGAGTSGSIAARFAAQFGLNVCLIDSSEKNQVGNKVCGDGILPSIFDFLDIDHPKGEELLSLKPAIKLYSPDEKNFLIMNVPMYLVDRIKFGQKLLNEAIEAGVTQFLDKTRAIDLVYEENSIVGIKVRLNNGKKNVLKAKIIIDASGYYSPLRRNIRSEIILKEVPKWDSVLCYREIIQFTKEEKPPFDLNYSTLIIDPGQRTPGGYIWYFPKTEKIVNIGLGTFMHYKGLVKEFFHKYALKNYIKTANFEILSSAGCVVPLRRPLPSCVDNGIIFVGDAACHVNPASGAGIDTGMKAGYFAALVIKEAIDEGDCSIHKLWDYNHMIMKEFGAAHASSDVVRLFFQHSPSEDINFVINKKLLNGNDITDLWLHGILELSLTKLAKRFIKGITRPKLMLKLNSLLKNMKKIYNHYQNYPKKMEQFENWRNQETKLFEKIYSKFINQKDFNS